MFQAIGNWAFDKNFLNNRMSFISGPRQVGKTTIAKLFLSKINQKENYYNWDSFTVKKSLNVLSIWKNIPKKCEIKEDDKYFTKQSDL